MTVQLTGAMHTNILKMQANYYLGYHKVAGDRQPTDIMVYAKSDKSSGARRVYHHPKYGFFIKHDKKRFEVDMNKVMQLLNANSLMLIVNSKVKYRRR